MTRWTMIPTKQKWRPRMFDFTYHVKFYKGESIVTMTVKAINEHQVCEKLGITKDRLIEIKMIDGI